MTLEAVIPQLAKNFVGAKPVEKVTVLAGILPVMTELGWNQLDFDEVDQQYPVSLKWGVDGETKGYVDIAFRDGDANLIFMEAKKWPNKNALLDEGNEKQLAAYCLGARRRPVFGVLTNGKHWRLYYIVKKPFALRLFAKFDIVQEPDKAVSHLKQFLSRSAFKDDQSIKKAQSGAYNKYKALKGDDEAAARILAILTEEKYSEELVSLISNAAKVSADQAKGWIQRHRPHIVFAQGPQGKPVSFKLWPSGIQRKVKKQWSKLLMAVCAEMRERHSHTFRSKALSRPDLFTDDASAKGILKDPVTGTKLFARFQWNGVDTENRCKEIVKLFEPETEINIIKKS